MQKIIFAVVFFAFFFLSDTAISQFYNGSQMTFGKNRIQHREFLWTYFKFDDFDTYFYLNGRELAVTAAKYTTIVLPGIEKKLETGLNDKIQFIIFNNLSDLKQSNIGLISEQRYNTGGITHIIGNKVFLYFNGSHQDFEKQIRSGIANVLFNQIMLGSSVGAQIKNSMLYALPKWYPNGLLSYMGEDWSTDIDNRVKDGILSGRYENFNQLEGEEALYAGHSFWRFVAQKYGKHTIGPIVNMTQISHSVENGFLYVIGISFNNLIEEWLNYYRGIYQIDEEAKDVAGQYIQKRIKKHNVYSRLKISPDGRNVAYTTNESGKYKLYIQDVHTKKRKKIFRGGFRLDEKIDYTYPIMAWHPNGQLLSFIVERKGEVYLYFYTLSEKKKQKVILYNFEKILNYSY